MPNRLPTLTEQITDARATHDILDVLGVRGKDRVIVCPLPDHIHRHNTPSFSIFWKRDLQWFRCHGCDTEGDVVDLIGFLRVTGYDKRDPEKIRQALAMLDERYKIHVPIPEPEKELKGNEHLTYLPPGSQAIEYALGRGLTMETIQKFKLGQNWKYLAMPCFEDGLLRGIKMRNMDPGCDKNRRFWQLEGSRLALFNHDAIKYKTGLIWIVKGEIPVMMMDQIGFPLTCAPTGGEASGTKRGAIQHWTEITALAAKIVIGDNDGPGRELGNKRKILFGAELRFPPGQFKDLDEWIKADPQDAYQTLLTWQEEVSSDWW